MELVSLNHVQESAATSTAELTAVAAGPGSGKTAVLVRRVEWLADQMDPAAIVAITYTNAAAREIAGRLRKGLKIGHCGTIHSWAIKLLREFGDLCGFPGRRWTVVDDAFWEQVLRRSALEMGWKGSNKALLEAEAGALLLDLAPRRPERDLPARVVLDAQRRLLREGLLNYSMVLKAGLLVADTLAQTGHPAAGALLVDEYQDCGHDTHELCQRARAASKFFVGDMDQAIMGFAGGSPSSFVHVWNKTPELAQFRLSGSYRCAPAVCVVAGRLIRNNKQRIDKKLTSYRIPPGTVTIKGFANVVQERAAIVKWIDSFPRSATVGILARTNFVADGVAQHLRESGMIVAVDRWSAPEGWTQARAIVAFLEDPERDAAARWMLETQRGKVSAEVLAHEAGELFQSINQAFLHVESGLPPEAAAAAVQKAGYTEAAEALRKLVAGLPPDATMADVALAMARPEDPQETQSGIWVGTIHRAKGREWDAVIVVGLEDGLLPSTMSTANMEEERRLLYVAMTRARNWLALTRVDRRHLSTWDKDGTVLEPSRFLKEIAG